MVSEPARSRSSATRATRLIGGNIHVLHFGVEIECFGSELAADAAHLEAAERRLHVDRRIAVDTEIAGADAAYHAQRAADVPRPDRAGETVLRVVATRTA